MSARKLVREFSAGCKYLPMLPSSFMTPSTVSSSGNERSRGEPPSVVKSKLVGGDSIDNRFGPTLVSFGKVRLFETRQFGTSKTMKGRETSLGILPCRDILPADFSDSRNSSIDDGDGAVLSHPSVVQILRSWWTSSNESSRKLREVSVLRS